MAPVRRTYEHIKPFTYVNRVNGLIPKKTIR